jgi:hypothetical protein
MEKYIAFSLYRKNEHGGHQGARAEPLGEDVYLASEADARFAEMRKSFETSSTDEENKLRARVAELEKAIGGALGALNKDIKIEPSSFIHEEFKSLMGG